MQQSTPSPVQPLAVRPAVSFAEAVVLFLRALAGKNRSTATIRAYQTDIEQFVRWLRENNVVACEPAKVGRADITEFLACLSDRRVCGVSRARKLAALREFFRFLEADGHVAKSPLMGVDTPKKERGIRAFLRPDEYTKLLSLAGASARDYAILQTFLQTGVRVSELCDLRLDEVDLVAGTLHVRGKGRVERSIRLETKGLRALKSWLAVRPQSANDHLFLNQYASPLGARGVRKLVAKYVRQAGITKRASPHTFRHTFGTYKAKRGVSPFQLKEWLGHANLNTTQIYVHMAEQNDGKLMEATSL